MANRIFMMTLLVRDYDEAIEYYTVCLGFELLQDEALDSGKRWVTIGNKNGCKILLAKAKGEQMSAIGNQFGGRVGLFLEAEDFDLTYSQFASKGVNFLEEIRDEPYGKVVQFADIYGNKWDLISSAKGKE